MGTIVPIEWLKCQLQAFLNLVVVSQIEWLFDIDNNITLG
jgi:hypothetical protein